MDQRHIFLVALFISLLSLVAQCGANGNSTAAGHRLRGSNSSETHQAEVLRAKLAKLAAMGAPIDFNQLASLVFQWQNYARQWPQAFASVLGGLCLGANSLQFLARQPAVPPLSWSDGMSRAAADLTNAAGPLGQVGHTGPDGSLPWDRVSKYGRWSSIVSENISYGQEKGYLVICQFVNDYGVPDFSHRLNMYDPTLTVTGISCGRHSVWGEMCTVEYAGGFAPF
mmetsp:Transcript_45779/g.74687  ORF Transcript_45779/g.74687 Transcript_45779/m.74687 type:complete len:226 (+) Transcript_45779:383-1060(+)|eukprot:CAMPEP_0184659604 /NCGR_PEP_ID=MMETSP0308-20130426/30331_1 /TAXON_ID=38269 /ORGANISM="Gloeochaete witrockiana, Strain SAG 46.84" /LENGTH=225 /DNA_ID=CAMNT_0027099559 /DNA_START=296 /DNA_END=973 /DNA_ORIENTATION=+